MKTTKYMLSVEFADQIIVYPMEISCKKYNEQIEFLLGEIDETVDCENPVELVSDGLEEHEEYKCYEMVFLCGCSHVILQKFTCKKGYHFI